METNTTTKGNSMSREKAINELGFICVTEWADGRVAVRTFKNEESAIKTAQRHDSIEGVSAFAYKMALGEAIA